ncbi:MAG: class I SAM-dependent methyltransferase [Proteobacteria bacterium]|jgi:SAM-dependent methyltransferase|nr:class I SAM-dependent methyltransferase [Pseudomonadota bacterium]
MEHREVRKIYTEMLPEAKPVHPLDASYRYLHLFLPEAREASVLDAGCGNGQYALRLASRDGYSNIDAVDLFEFINTHDAFRYQQASIDNLPFDDECFDLVYSMSVIYYLDDARDAFREFFRVMKPGSRLVISAHTKFSLHTLERRVRRRLGGVRHLRGIRFSSPNSYVRQMRECGLEVENVWGYGLSYPKRNPLARARRKILTRRNPAGIKAAMSLPRWVQYLVGNLGYHSLIAAKKPSS